jgi:hypothetical protein
MAPQFSVAQHILIKTLLTEGFKTQLIAPRAVQRIRLGDNGPKWPPEEEPAPAATTHAESPSYILNEQPYYDLGKPTPSTLIRMIIYENKMHLGETFYFPP